MVRTIPDTGIEYALVSFDKDGLERTDDPSSPGGRFCDKVIADAAISKPTNVFLFAHGWKGDLPSAVDQYNRWIKAMVDSKDDLEEMGRNCRPLWIGLHWPSKPLGQESLDADFNDVETSPDSLKHEALQQMGDTPEIRECLEIIFRENDQNAAALTMPPHVTDAYKRLADAVGYKSEGPGGAPDADGTPFDPEKAFDAYGEADFGVGSFFGKLLSPLSQLSYWKMKYRARKIGEHGMHDFVVKLQQALPSAKFHLMGHSFGCIVVSSILGGIDGKNPLSRKVDSLALVQGALSLWSYADKVKGSDKSGYYNAAFRGPAVAGPIIVTRSSHDSAVGKAYPLASALIPFLGNDFGEDGLTPGDLPFFGGIGTFGIRGLAFCSDLRMLPPNGAYTFKAGKIYNLMSDDFILSHNGIDGAEVAHAMWRGVIASV